MCGRCTCRHARDWGFRADPYHTGSQRLFLPEEDVRLGRDAAAVARRQLPILTDSRINAYVKELGRRLAAAIPSEFRQPAFGYSFDVVNLDQLSAFALPGRSILVSRGMIEAARTEGELAGVIGHELGHVVLRHGTAQATAADKFQIGEIAGQAIGASVAGAVRDIMAQGASFGLSTYFLKYAPEHERQADLLGARIMARAGYDPAELADVFHTIANEGGGRGGPQWMRSHPNPGDRDVYIIREALQIGGSGVTAGELDSYASRDTYTLYREGSSPTPGEFDAIQAGLRSMPAARTADEVAGPQRVGVPVGARETVVRRPVPVPAGDVIQMSIPANWRRVWGGNTAMFAPDGAVFDVDGGSAAFTHGIQVGVARSLTGNLQLDTEALLQSFGEANPQLRWAPSYQRTTIGGRPGLTTVVNNVSALTRQFEYVSVSTVDLDEGNFLYVIGIAPQDEAGIYRQAFERVQGSIQLAN